MSAVPPDAGVDHALLTRFNLPSKGNESLVRAQEDWLRNRVALFERYCLPSVAAQSCRSFVWIIYFDPLSPPWLLEWVRSHELAGSFHPCLRTEVTTPDLLADIRAAFGRASGGELLTTNLDNDDSLAVDFVARVQAAAPVGGRTAVYIGDGLIRRGTALYRWFDRHNAFCSVREPWEGAVGCWADWHNLLSDQMPAVVLRGAPGWQQVVHGANVSNRVRGRRTQPSRHRPAFSGLLDDLPEATARQLATELLVSLPGRAVREGGRACAKAVLGAVAGKAGLDRAKAIWTSTRRAAR